MQRTPLDVPPAPQTEHNDLPAPPPYTSAEEVKEVCLEKVIGVSAESNAAFVVNPMTGCLAYPAGRTIVIYDPRSNRQVHFINTGTKTVSCLAWSSTGDLLAVGERGHQPQVHVYKCPVDAALLEASSEYRLISSLQYHKFGVAAVAFSPGRAGILVSVGFKHDQSIVMWDWNNGNNEPFAVGMLKKEVHSLCFVDGNDEAHQMEVCTASSGGRLEVWKLSTDENTQRQLKPYAVGLPTVLQKCDFVSVGVDTSSLYALTSTGILCSVNLKEMLVSKWVGLNTPSAFAVSIGSRFMAVACSSGVVRIFKPKTLEYVTTLPLPPAYGEVNKPHLPSKTVSEGTENNDKVYPHCVCVSVTPDSLKAFVMYADRSIVAWGLADTSAPIKLRSFLNHSSCIWDLVIPAATTSRLQQDLVTEALLSIGDERCTSLANERKKFSLLPDTAFVTCSADNTVRIWDINGMLNSSEALESTPPRGGSVKWFRTNSDYGRNLKHVIYFDMDGKPSKNDSGVRCIDVSPDGLHLASGDRHGNIRVHDVQTMKEITGMKRVHDAEVLSLTYSPVAPPLASIPSPRRRKMRIPSSDVTASLLASGGRDRMIHLFDVQNNYKKDVSLENHSASVMGVCFSLDGSRLFSCGGDRSIVISRVKKGADNSTDVCRDQSVTAQYGTIYDMSIHANNRWLVTAGQEKRVQVWSTFSGKKLRSWRPIDRPGALGSASKDIELNKLHLDATGTYAATCSFDKFIRIYDFLSGECVSRICGHGELITGVHFTADSKRLVSVSGDGCIFIWKLPEAMSAAMIDRRKEMLMKKVRDLNKALSEEEKSLPESAIPSVVIENKDYSGEVTPEDAEWLSESAKALNEIPPQQILDDDEEYVSKNQPSKGKENGLGGENLTPADTNAEEDYSLDDPDSTMQEIMDEAAAVAQAEANFEDSTAGEAESFSLGESLPAWAKTTSARTPVKGGEYDGETDEVSLAAAENTDFSIHNSGQSRWAATASKLELAAGDGSSVQILASRTTDALDGGNVLHPSGIVPSSNAADQLPQSPSRHAIAANLEDTDEMCIGGHDEGDQSQSLGDIEDDVNSQHDGQTEPEDNENLDIESITSELSKSIGELTSQQNKPVASEVGEVAGVAELLRSPSPPPPLIPAKTLAEERQLMKAKQRQQETHRAVDEMRKKLAEMGIVQTDGSGGATFQEKKVVATLATTRGRNLLREGRARRQISQREDSRTVGDDVPKPKSADVQQETGHAARNSEESRSTNVGQPVSIVTNIARLPAPSVGDDKSSPLPPPAPPETPSESALVQSVDMPQQSPVSPTRPRMSSSPTRAAAVASSLARPASAYRESIRALKASVEQTLSLFGELSTVHASISTQKSFKDVAREQEEIEQLMSDFRNSLSGIGSRVSDAVTVSQGRAQILGGKKENTADSVDPATLNLLGKYSDILVDLVKKKMQQE